MTGAVEHDASLAPGDARAVLSALPIAGDWKVRRARSGWSQRTFVAFDGTRRLFVKFGVAVAALRRLAELAVTPPVLEAGEYRGHPFVVQPFLRGRHPHYGWFERHLLELARLVSAYQWDAQLRALTTPGTTPTHKELVSGVLDDLELRARSGITQQHEDGHLMQAIDQLRRLSGDLQASELVATHGDPNLKNFIVTDALYLVDWDELALSDPLRDVGQLLWWYVSPRRWNNFLEPFGVKNDADLRDRLNWWVAAESLDVALKLAVHGDHRRAEAFLRDFAAAIEQRSNPHARF